MADHKAKIQLNLDKQIHLLQDMASLLQETKLDLKNDINKFASLKLPIMINRTRNVEPSTSHNYAHDDYVLTSLRPLDLDI